MKTVIIPISGGMDSAYLMWKALHEGYDVYPLVFDDGTTTYSAKVVGPASGLVRMAGLHHRIKTLPLALTNNERIHDAGFGFIPGRNMSMALAAIGYAHFIVEKSADKEAFVWFGFAASNEKFYPDQGMNMFAPLGDLYNKIYDTNIFVELPVEHMDRLQVLQAAYAIGVPLDKTVSCQRTPVAINCGVCPRCQERRHSFVMADIEDETLYLKDL